jgi:NADH-quinone oxidoreductase subunit M
MEEMGGLWIAAPRMGAMALVFALASLGLPALGNFVAEFLILMGTWRVSEPATVLGAVGLVAATVYSLWIVQRVFQGRETPAVVMTDLSPAEGVMLAAMAAPLIWLGVYPQPVFNAVRPSLTALQQHAVRATPATPAGARLAGQGTAAAGAASGGAPADEAAPTAPDGTSDGAPQ